MRVKYIIYGILAVIMGAWFLFGGVSTLSNSNTVTCGNETMSQGDSCVEWTTNSSQTSTYDYDQEKQNDHSTGVFILIAGAFFLISGLGLLYYALRR